MPISSGPVGTLVTHHHLFADGDGDGDANEVPYYHWTPLKASGLNKYPWSEQPLSITSLVGIPLKWMPFTMTMSGENPSDTVALLSIDCDPKSLVFGSVLQSCSIDALLCRAGGEDLHDFHVEALVAFVQTVLGDLVSFCALVDEDEIDNMRSKAELAAARATRAEFQGFHRSYYTEKVAANEKLKVVECPFTAVPFRQDMPRCICGTHRGCDGASLSLCSKCKNVRYCSSECQKKDWKAHKKICGKK